MPTPKKNESKQDYLRRCTRQLVDEEGKKADKAFAQCNGMWNQHHKDVAEPYSGLSLNAYVELAADDPEPEGPVRFHLLAYTGDVIDLGWSGKYIFDVNGITARSKIPALREHQRDKIVGTIDKIYKKEGAVYETGLISNVTEDGKEVLGLAREGYPWQASIGIWAKEVKRLRDDKEKAVVNGREVKGPIDIWLQAEIRETSFVSLGADDETAAIVLSADSDESQLTYITAKTEGGDNMDRNEMIKQLTDEMSLEELIEAFPQVFDAGTDAAEKRHSDVVKKERNRVLEIIDADADENLTRKAIEDGTEASEFYKNAWKAHQEQEKEAEKQRKEDLKKLGEETPATVKAEIPKEPDTSRMEAADAELTKRASELAEKENITVSQAMKRILAEDHELAQRYYGTYEVGNA